MNLSAVETATTVLLLGQSGFYSMGRSNSIATLDLLNGFNGLGASSVVGVMLQTVLSNWIGPVWWLFAGLRLLSSQADTKQEPLRGKQNGNAVNFHDKQSSSSRRGEGRKSRVEAGEAPYFEYLALHTMFSGLSSLALTVVCVYTWGHEDLWNVFAPKFINASLWAFFYQLVMNCLGCSSVWFIINDAE